MSTAQHSTTRTSADNAFFVVFNLIFFFFIFLHFIFSCFSKRVRCCVWPVCDMHTYILLACVSKVQIHHHHHHHHLQFDAMASEFAHENDKRSQSQNTSVRTSNGCEKLSEKKHACILRCERPAARVQCWAFFLHIEATATVWNGAMVEARSWSTHDLCNHWPHTHTFSTLDERRAILVGRPMISFRSSIPWCISILTQRLQFSNASLHNHRDHNTSSGGRRGATNAKIYDKKQIKKKRKKSD